MPHCDWCHRQESEYVLIHQVFTFGKDNVTYSFCDARCADMFAKRYVLVGHNNVRKENRDGLLFKKGIGENSK